MTNFYTSILKVSCLVLLTQSSQAHALKSTPSFRRNLKQVKDFDGKYQLKLVTRKLVDSGPPDTTYRFKKVNGELVKVLDNDSTNGYKKILSKFKGKGKYALPVGAVLAAVATAFGVMSM